VIDTHAHLDACADEPRELMARARAAGVERVITIGTGISSCREALELAEQDPGVFAVLGIHPHQAGEATARDCDELRQLLRHPRAVGVGESGLDYFRDYAPRDRQRELFELHAQLAAEMGRPLVVHTRHAEQDTLAVLESLPSGVGVVLHCFSSPLLLEAAVERRWYVSFAGNVTYPRAPELRAAAAAVAGDRLLLETDAPYLAPQQRRGRPNEPAFVVHTLAVVADARGEDPEELGRQVEANARRAFDLP
jgi:TatD DNase family protein